MTRKKVLFFYIILMALVTFLSLAPYKYISWIKLLNLKHIVAYMFFSFTTIYLLKYLKQSNLKSIIYSLLIVSALGGTLEYLQQFTASRKARINDFASNYLGFGLGLTLFFISLNYSNQKKD